LYATDFIIQAVFPSITKFGMAALLPHKKLSVVEKNGSVSVLADGEPKKFGYPRD